MQSSSASTSVIVGLVASGALGVEQAVPMVMGANIGTTVTNTLVSLGHVRQSAEFKRAFAAATVHDFFNVLAVSILLPIELIFKPISSIFEMGKRTPRRFRRNRMEKAVKNGLKKTGRVAERHVGQFGASGNVKGALMVATGLAIVLVALALVTRNMKALVAAPNPERSSTILGKAEASSTGCRNRGHHRSAVIEHHDLNTDTAFPAAGVLTLRNAYPVTLGQMSEQLLLRCSLRSQPQAPTH